MCSILYAIVLITACFDLYCIAANVEVDKDGNIVSGYSSAVHEKGWVQETIADHNVIIKNNNITAYLDQKRNFRNKIALTFVTPWNKQGYKWTKSYAKKFTHISPVWYDIQPIPGSASSIAQYMVMGENNVDVEWMESVRLKNERIHILPRYTLSSQHWSLDLIGKFLKNKKSKKELINVLIKSMRNKVHAYNGCVLEITPFFNYLAHNQRQYNDKQMTRKEFSKIKKKFTKFIESLSKRLRRSKKYIYLVMSPYHIKLVNFNTIFKYVRCAVLMTYDFSVNQNEDKHGGNAPLNWLKDIIETIKEKKKQKLYGRHEWRLLMGLNFYGYLHSSKGTDAIIGDELIELLKKEGDKYQWKWDGDISEHYLINKEDDSIKIYYPTLMSIATRIELASMYKIGLAIWELGQGMEYFTDLL